MRKSLICLIIVIIIFALFSRFAFLDLRALHHDEGVNYFFAEKILNGEGYKYDSTNYHGPLYFYLIAVSFFISGVSEFSLRFPAVVFGLLIALFPLIFGTGARRERLVSSIFLLLSPSLMYYSRYSIHEVVFVFFGLVCVYSLSLIIERRDLGSLPAFAFALSAIFVLKETAIIMLFVLFVIVVFNWRRIKGVKFIENYKIIGASIVIFILVYVLFFTSFFSNLAGLGDSFRAFSPWIDRGLHEAGHDKPFYYYFLLILEYEWPILLFALIGLFCFKRLKDKRFYFNLVIWFVLTFLIYSLISYKTPWLVINFVVPMCFLAGFGFNSTKGKWKWILFGFGLLYLIYMAFYLNFINYSGEWNKFAYVHTNSDVLRLVDKINEVYKGDRILIASNEYWPLPFYFDGKKISYLLEEDFLEYYSEIDNNVIIMRDSIFREQDWKGHNFEEYKLRERIKLIVLWEK